MLRHHSHTVSTIEYKGQKLPLIRLSGKWLERKGFKPGCKFEVFEMMDSLVLSLPWKREKKTAENNPQL